MVLIISIHFTVCLQQLKVTKYYPFLPHLPLNGILLTNDTYKIPSTNTSKQQSSQGTSDNDELI